MTTTHSHSNSPDERRERWVKRLAVAATIGMFIVLMMGSTVTNTGSGEGCGRSWPLCQGKFVPEYAVETAIEFSHRIVTAIEGILIAATAIGAILIRRGNKEVKIYVGIMVGTLLLQSGLGAAAVMWPQSPQIMAMHFGISMTCFAAVFLLTRLLYEPPGAVDPITRQAQSNPPPAWFTYGVWATLAGSIVVAYVGAYMRHSGNELACYQWPSCNGQLVPDLTSPAGISFTHRVAAALLMILVYGLTYAAYRMRQHYPSLFAVFAGASVFISLQALAGGAVVLSELDLWTTLAHAALMAWLFVFITDACRQILKTRRPLRSEPAPLIPQPAGAVGSQQPAISIQQ
jgi:cytochrome c oxidase assembly protein subunit 15